MGQEAEGKGAERDDKYSSWIPSDKTGWAGMEMEKHDVGPCRGSMEGNRR